MAETVEQAAEAQHPTINARMGFVTELFSSPLNITLMVICSFLLYKIFSNRRQKPLPPVEPQLPSMKKRDFTVEQLREFDGNGKDGRILIALNGNVFDVTKEKRFYGPGGPYGAFAGRDASRGLATFSLTEDVIRTEYDDLSDLNTTEMDGMREWEMQFKEKYDKVGRLLKPGEEMTDYTDTEEEQSSQDKKDD
ncbi:hypothetical protein NP493_994g01000 [Ridgeia piscesae]|uniref:Cytochrome b5 heme-binding domain-containing protein n=1 Tax=Ridgeia piscesae TaxID=27915 RepID=A0AAD9KIA0_RIDPI|nr:hypothetical protein NP493_994g01000 [Ridgeia piscesae]